MQKQQQDFYNPSTQDGFDDGMVLQPVTFKPFRNRKTNNFFSYSYNLMERNRSGNSDSNMEWVTKAPAEMQRKIDAVREIHEKVRGLFDKMKVLAKKGTQYQVDELKEVIDGKFDEINELIYPVGVREYIESAEAKRLRLENQNELTLDAGSIAALRGEAAPAVMGSTADASIAEAKLQVAEEKLKKMQAAIDSNAQETTQDEKDAEIAMLRKELDKSPSRRKAEFKTK